MLIAIIQESAGMVIHVPIERFYNPTRRHSPLGYLSPLDSERQARVA